MFRAIKKARQFIIACLSLWILVSTAHAELVLEITQGVNDALPIAIVPFKWAGSGKPPQDIAAIVTADLTRSGQFAPLPEKDMLAKPFEPQQIRFKNWRIVDVPNLVIGKLSAVGNDTYVVEFRLFDVYRQKQLAGFRYTLKGNQLRIIAHKISDIVYESLTGVKGAFDTKIVYIKKFPKGARDRYRLYISDADLHNEQEIIRHYMPILSPVWSPDNSKIAFAMAGSFGAGVFVFDLKTGKPPVRVTPHNIKASAPSWSPDGKHLALQVMANGSSDIYTLDLDTHKLERITHHWSIDAEPAWSPDNKSIIFTSDRGGSAQLYQYFFDSKQIKRLTFNGRQNLRAAFSPDGKLITFVHLTANNGYNVAVMNLSTGEMRIVADSKHGESEVESPSFAPNGSMIIYAANYAPKGKKAIKAGLVVVSVDGKVRQHFVDDSAGEVREPAWSYYFQ